MENGKAEMDSVHELHSPPLTTTTTTTQLPGSFEENLVLEASSSEAEPVLKAVLKEQVLADASEIVNGGDDEQDGGSTSVPTVENGKAAPASSPKEAEPEPSDGTGEGAEAGAEEELDADGYRVEERRETETLSHTEEITEKPERTELRTREVKEVTMEELKTRETTRPVSLEELKAILEAEFDKTDEVEIGRDIIIEEFSRVESEHEEASGGRVTLATFSVKEEHKTQEIKEQLQFKDEAERRVDEVVETVEEVQEVKIPPSSEGQAEALDGEVDSAKSEVVAAVSEEVAAKSEEVVEKSENKASQSETVPLRGEEPSASAEPDKAKPADEHKGGEKEKGSKSRGIINYIKVKARSLSRDRSHNKAAALAAHAAAQAPADESGEPQKEVPQSNDGGRSSAKKTKQKKWKLFGKKSADEHDNSSSEASVSEDESDKKVKLIAFAKKSDDPKEDGDEAAKTPSEGASRDDKKSTKEEGKQGRTKIGFNRKGRQKREADQKQADDESKPKAAESEPEGAGAGPAKEEVELPQQEVVETEHAEGGAKKPKEHKWFHFGKKPDKEAQELEEKTDAGTEVKVPESESTEVVKSVDHDADQPPEVPASDDKKSSENLATSPESKVEGQEKVTKEHKKFSFGSLFGKKNKKSQDKSEQKSSKESDAIEPSKTEGETTDTNEKVLETTATSESQISVNDAEKADAVAETEQSSEGIEEGRSSALVDEQQPAEVVRATSEVDDCVNTDQVPELPIKKDQANDDVHEADVGIIETVPVSDSVWEKEDIEAGQDNKTSLDVQADEVFVEALHLGEIPATVPESETTIDSEEKVVSVSEHLTEHNLDGSTLDESKQLDASEKHDGAVPEIEKETVVEPPVLEGAVEPTTAPENITSDAPEVSIEAQTAENGVEETQLDSPLKKEAKQSKKFSFGLKMGQKKDSGSKSEDETTPKHKVWSPFAKKPAKKEKEGQVAAAEAEQEQPVVVAEIKTPEQADAEHAEEVAKVEVAEPKQSESREGTLKRNKGIHKLFSFGKKTNSVDEKAGAAAEANAEPEPLDKTLEGGSTAPAEKGASEGVEEEKHRHKKFSFGLKFGKKHDKDGAAGDGSKQQQTPTEDLAVGEGAMDSAPAGTAATEPEVEQITLPTTQSEIESGTGEQAAIKLETGELSLSQSERTGVIVPETYQIVVADESQGELAAGQEVLIADDNKVNVEAEKSELQQPGKDDESAKLAEKIETDEQLPTANVDITLVSSEPVDRSTAQNLLTGPSLECPKGLELSGNETFGHKDDSAVVSENEEELIPKTEVRLLEESGVDLEADRPTLEFGDMNKLVDDIMKSELESDAKLSENVRSGEITEMPALVVTESRSEKTSATPADTEVLAITETEGPKSEPQEKPTDVTERVEHTETKPDGQSETAVKEQKQKKHLFGIKFGKKTKQTASKEKIEAHEQNGAPAEASGGGPVERTESDLSSEPDRNDGKTQDKSKESQSIEELIIEVEVREEKDESKTEDGEERSHHAGGIKWPHFGKKSDKRKEEKETGEHAAKSDEVETTESADASSKQPKGTSKKPSHGLGKGFLKIFSPKKQQRSDKNQSKSNGDSEEPVVVYQIDAEGQVVAETHWRPRHDQEPTKTSDQHHTPEETNPATNGKVSNDEEEVVHKEITLNGSAHDELEAHVVHTSQSAETPHPPGSTSPGHFVVVAIDFGTTFSGYAFSFINDPDSIHMMRKWEGGDPGVINQKTPTTILLTPDGHFHSFGFTARDFYHDLEAAEAGRWMYFEKFKMTLHHNTELNKDTTIVASNGKDFPAMQLFSYALRFFKDHALKELTSQSSVTIDNDDVRWVITVPAIWKAPAKQFMRQAAYQAGIASPFSPDRLLIALEPEAASIYVRKLRMSQLVPVRAAPSLHPTSPRKETTPSPVPAPTEDLDGSLTTAPGSEQLSDHLKAGTRYMVVDCGGGTVDITVHELETDRGSLKELFKATGGPFGSTGVDQDFEKLLFEIFGSEFIETFKQKRPAGWVDLMIAFESRKRAANPHKDNPLNVSLPFSFIDFYKKQHGNQVDCAIKRFGGDRGVTWSLQGMLRLTPEAMQNLFRTTLDRITSAISDVLNNPTVKDIEYLFLVGGFSESPMLQHELRTAFDDKVRIIIPQDVSLTILKGAVCFGLDPTVVTVRQSRMTYGVGVVNRFDSSRHPESKRIQRDGNDWCVGIFDTFVTSGQPVTLGDKVIRRYAPANRDQKTSIIHVYCSESSDIQYVTDPGVQRCATMRLDLVDVEEETGVEPGTARREIETTMTFGDTEIRVSARDATTGRNVGSTIDFLNK